MSLFVLGSVVHCDWLKHSQLPTHTPGYTTSHRTRHTFLSHLCVYLSKAEPVNQSDLCVVYTQIMPNCWRASQVSYGGQFMLVQDIKWWMWWMVTTIWDLKMEEVIKGLLYYGTAQKSLLGGGGVFFFFSHQPYLSTTIQHLANFWCPHINISTLKVK